MLRRFFQIGMMALVLAISLSAGGCIIAGYAASVYGDPPVAALYVPAKTPMLVIVKDPPDPTGMRIESDTVALHIEEQIKSYDVAPLVPAAKVDEFRSTNLSGFAGLPPAQVGRAVGAEQVLNVRILSSTVNSGTARDMLQGQISVEVSVIDVNSGHTIWPNDGSNGVVVNYSTPMVRVAGSNSPQSVSRSLYAGIADKTVKLFRKYKPDQE